MSAELRWRLAWQGAPNRCLRLHVPVDRRCCCGRQLANLCLPASQACVCSAARHCPAPGASHTRLPGRPCALQERFEERYAQFVSPKVAEEAAISRMQHEEAARRHLEASGRNTDALEQHCAVGGSAVQRGGREGRHGRGRKMIAAAALCTSSRAHVAAGSSAQEGLLVLVGSHCRLPGCWRLRLVCNPGPAPPVSATPSPPASPACRCS